MYYYIIENDIVVYGEPVEGLLRLTAEQVDYHLANSSLSTAEVLQMKTYSEIANTEEVKTVLIENDIKYYLTQTDGPILRHRDELELEEPTTLTQAEYTHILRYRKYLRKLSSDVNYPNVTVLKLEEWQE